MSFNHVKDISDLPPHWLIELRSFFEDYKKLENKTVEVQDFQNKEVAMQVVTQAMKDYDDKFGDRD